MAAAQVLLEFGTTAKGKRLPAFDGHIQIFSKNPCRRNNFDKILSTNCHVDELSFRQKIVDKILSTNYCRQKFVDESDCRQNFVDR